MLLTAGIKVKTCQGVIHLTLFIQPKLKHAYKILDSFNFSFLLLLLVGNLTLANVSIKYFLFFAHIFINMNACNFINFASSRSYFPTTFKTFFPSWMMANNYFFVRKYVYLAFSC